jgi:hypothetical protein
MLLEEIGEPQRAMKKRDDLSSWSPPVVGVRNRGPIPPHYPLSQSDWEKPYENRDCEAPDFAAENKTTNQLRVLNHPATEARGQVGSDSTHMQRFEICGMMEAVGLTKARKFSAPNRRNGKPPTLMVWQFLFVPRVLDATESRKSWQTPQSRMELGLGVSFGLRGAHNPDCRCTPR